MEREGWKEQNREKRKEREKKRIVTDQVIYRPAAKVVLQSVMHPNKQIASLTALSILLSITNLQPTP
jgi:hypothetical protein